MRFPYQVDVHREKNGNPALIIGFTFPQRYRFAAGLILGGSKLESLVTLRPVIITEGSRRQSIFFISRGTPPTRVGVSSLGQGLISQIPGYIRATS